MGCERHERGERKGLQGAARVRLEIVWQDAAETTSKGTNWTSLYGSRPGHVTSKL